MLLQKERGVAMRSAGRPRRRVQPREVAVGSKMLRPSWHVSAVAKAFCGKRGDVIFGRIIGSDEAQGGSAMGLAVLRSAYLSQPECGACR